jgi:hypothetical protein
MDSNIRDQLEAMVIGTISATEDNIDPISLLPTTFRYAAYMMMKKGGAKLAEHNPYDYAIDIRDGKTPL